MIPSEFRPHPSIRPMRNGSPYSIRADRKQVHMSAATYRHLGKPEEIALFSSENDDGSLSLLFIDADRLDNVDFPTLGVSPKKDADTVRLQRFPYDVRMMMGRERHEAAEVRDDGTVMFVITPEEGDDGQ